MDETETVDFYKVPMIKLIKYSLGIENSNMSRNNFCIPAIQNPLFKYTKC